MSPPAHGGRRIVVVVPTLQEEATVERVVRSLLPPRGADADVQPIDVRLIVADGGSTDGTRAIVARIAAEDDRVVWLDNPRRIQAAAVNLAARSVAGTADVLIRCDAHADYPTDFVARVADALERSGASALVVPMDSIGITATGRAIAWVSDTPMGSGGSAHRGGRASGWVDHGHHAGWRLDRFLALGGYDEGFSHNEDAEFDCRLRAAGGRIWLAADIRLTYRVRPTLRALWRQYRAYGRGRSRTVRRHPGSLRLRQLAVPTAVGGIAASLAIAPWLPAALTLPLLYAAASSATSAAGACAIGRCGWRAGPAATTMHVAWALGFVEGLAFVRERRWRPHDAAAFDARREYAA